MNTDYHIAAKMLPLQPGEDGLAHATLLDVPDGIEVIIGETMLNEYGGFVTITFVESRDHEEDEKPRPNLELVTNDTK